MGYHRPVASFNLGKQAEFPERAQFIEAPGTEAVGRRPVARGARRPCSAPCKSAA